jgi:hypothetical protein
MHDNKIGRKIGQMARPKPETDFDISWLMAVVDRPSAEADGSEFSTPQYVRRRNGVVIRRMRSDAVERGRMRQ